MGRYIGEISGRGIGLAAVRAECERLGGTVGVTSERGRGTTFRFRFPSESVMMLEGRVRDLIGTSLPPASGHEESGDHWNDTWDDRPGREEVSLRRA